MIYNQQSSDSKEFQEYIQKDDLQALLRADRFKQEVSHNTQIQQYLGKPGNVQKLLEYLYDPSTDQSRQQLNTSSNDVMMADCAPVLDTIASNPQFLLQVFHVLTPFNENTSEYFTVEDLPKLPASERRVPLVCAENFCRLIFTLIKQQARFLKVLQFVAGNLEIMTWFVYAIQSAAITETLHYLFKADKSPEISNLQTKIIVESCFVPELYHLFDGVGIFEELVHVAFIFQSFLTTDLKAEVKWEVLNHLTPVVERVLDGIVGTVTGEISNEISSNLSCSFSINQQSMGQNVQPWCLKSLYTIIAISIKQIVRHGVMAETVEQAKQSSNALDLLLDILIPRLGVLLSLQLRPSVPSAINLLVSHTAALIGELLKVQEATLDFIKEKEQLLLNHQYKPEFAIQYLTQYYKNQPTDQHPLPLVIGFSFIFQDIYVHLHEATQFEFNSQFTKQVQQVHQSSNKQVSALHLFGPNKEICNGSVEHITSRLISAGLFKALAAQCYAHPEAGVLHYVILQSVQIMTAYLPFQVPFVQEFISEEFFKRMAEAIHSPLGQPRSQAIRTSLEALAAYCVKAVAEKQGFLPEVAQHIAKDLEVKEALGM